MKFFRNLLIFILLFCIVGTGLLFYIGYSYYSDAIEEKSLTSRVEEVKSKEHFTSFDNLPKNYVNAVVAVEDHRYYDHGPIDPIGILRALFVNVKNQELQEGGSTITQQVSKNIIFTQEETLKRKLGELFGAYELENNYSKDEILALYVNSSYFGDGYYTIYDAAKGYYKKELEDLSLSECAMLAGLPNAPSVYSPTVNPDLAKKRQKHVLDKMLEYHYISQGQYNESINN